MTKWLREDLVVNATLRDIFTSERCLDRRGAAHKFIDGVDPIEGKHLYNCVRENGLARTLEVGCAMGTSALYFCQAFADGRGGAHVAIDPNQDTQYKSIARANVGARGLAAHFRVLREPSDLAMPRLLARGARFDLVFVDGWHTFDFTLLDMFYAERLLVPNGLLLLDDIQHKGVQKTLKYVRTNYCHEGGSLGHRGHARGHDDGDVSQDQGRHAHVGLPQEPPVRRARRPPRGRPRSPCRSLVNSRVGLRAAESPALPDRASRRPVGASCPRGAHRRRGGGVGSSESRYGIDGQRRACPRRRRWRRGARRACARARRAPRARAVSRPARCRRPRRRGARRRRHARRGRDRELVGEAAAAAASAPVAASAAVAPAAIAAARSASPKRALAEPRRPPARSPRWRRAPRRYSAASAAGACAPAAWRGRRASGAFGRPRGHGHGAARRRRSRR